MINRFSLVASKEKIFKTLGKLEFTSDYYLSYNIAPLDFSYIITQEEKNLIQSYRWGLVPAWSRQGINSGNLYNAKSHGIVSKPSFRIPIRQKRCVIIADSFYAIEKSGDAHRVYNRNQGVLLFAGLYDQCHVGGQLQSTFTMITVPANREVARCSDASPVLLNEEEKEIWLSGTSSVGTVLSLLKPNDNYTLSCYKVSSEVKNKEFNNPTLHEEVVNDMTLFDLK